MATPIASSNTTFLGLTSLEAQAVFILSRIVSLQNVYNAANTANPANRIVVTPDYVNRSLNMQFVVALESDAAEQVLHDNIVPFLP